MLLSCFVVVMYAQNAKFTREQVLNMTMDQLSDLPLEDLMSAVDAVGVSSVDDLFALIMNKNVSSASKKEEDSFTSPLSSSVLTKEEIRTYGCLSIEEALRLIPGCIVSERANGMFAVSLRGLSGIPDNNMWVYAENVTTLLMIDSRPVFNYTYGGLIWESLPIGIEDVERIEIVRGPCSALYGSNAVTGVINIITDKGGNGHTELSGSANVGNMNTFVGDIAYRKFLNDKWSFCVTSNLQQRDRNTDEIYFIPRHVANGVNGSSSDLREYVNGEYVESEGGFVSLDRLKNSKLAGKTLLGAPGVYNLKGPEMTLDDIFPDTKLARKNYGVNGYLQYCPTADINISLTGGYQSSIGLSTPSSDEYYSLCYRTSKTAYGNLQTDIKGINLQANYFDGVQDFSIGSPVFKLRNRQFNGSLEYDWSLFEGFNVRPGVSYQWNNFDDTEYQKTFDYLSYYGGDKARTAMYGELSGDIPLFLGESVDMSSFSGTLRFDYTNKDFRAIAAIRAEKTDMPDKWFPTWQLGLSYQINDDNFIRFVYGRANRSSVLVNTSSSYLFHRTAQTPGLNDMAFDGTPDGDVMQADNIELGYRWRPTTNVLIDAEAFYSKSWGYSALMAYKGYMMSNIATVSGFMNSNLDLSSPQAMQQSLQMAMGQFFNNVKTKAFIKNADLDLEAKQMGISLNIDWIISDKLIAKAHANVQQTKMDKYFDYSQDEDITRMLTNSAYQLAGTLLTTGTLDQNSIIGKFMTSGGDKNAVMNVMSELLANGTIFYEDGTQASIQDFADPSKAYKLLAMGESKGKAFDQSVQNTRNGVGNKALPSFYGMIGLVYKPIKSISISAYGYYMGNRELRTLYSISAATENGQTVHNYGAEKIDSKFNCNVKIGYRPMPKFEINFNARNIFNNDKVEYAYTDNICGLYTVGVNFDF